MPSTSTGLSPITRLVNRTLTALEACDYAIQPGRACLLRGFDGQSRHRAHQVRTRLTRHGIAAFTATVPMVALDPQQLRDQHVCVHVDVETGQGEASRVAALTHTPLVTLSPSPTDQNALESTMPALTATFGPALNQSDHRPFPSAFGHILDVAFDTFLITPNQPETGELTVRIGDVGARDLPPGTSISLHCLPEAVLAKAIDPRGETVTWISRQVEIRQRSGIHQIFRDGLCVTDLDRTMIVEHDIHGLGRLHA